jgi:hypothetical protein
MSVISPSVNGLGVNPPQTTRFNNPNLSAQSMPVVHGGQVFKAFQATQTMPFAAEEHDKADVLTHAAQNKGARAQAALNALGFIGLGLLLNRIPAKASAFEMVSTNIEDWVKMGLGVLAVEQINKATQAKPKPWQHALETVTVLTLIAQGLNPKGWKHFPLLAVTVPLLVQATQAVNKLIETQLDKHNSQVPRWLPRLGVTLASTLGGVYGLRSVMQTSAYRTTTGQQAMGAELLICSRCGGSHLVCMEEVSDLLGTMAGWFKHSVKQPTPSTGDPSQHDA